MSTQLELGLREPPALPKKRAERKPPPSSGPRRYTRRSGDVVVTVEPAGVWWKVTIDAIRMPLPSLMNLREHWSGNIDRKHLQQESTRAFVLQALRGGRLENASPTNKVAVTFTRLGPKDLDDDNCISSLKYVRDAVAKTLGSDDGPKAPIRWRYYQERARAVAVRIELLFVGDSWV